MAFSCLPSPPRQTGHDSLCVFIWRLVYLGGPINAGSADKMTGVIALAIGIVLVCGAFFRWRWLVDPPDEMSPYYSQALLKTIFGRRGVVWFTYFLGVLFMAAGILGLFPNLLPGKG
ncbi:immunity 17 family protein [Candidatus Binatus sp.]|uniref:immunity 17 family protein n=1 Tax=Candidatus Binatus sp. TaxID=2811406 RepID=UPI003C6F55A9